jgi:hypothetical protein
MKMRKALVIPNIFGMICKIHLISKSPELNDVVLNIDASRKESVNDGVHLSTKTCIIRNVADTLFSRETKNRVEYAYVNKKRLCTPDWFDYECFAGNQPIYQLCYSVAMKL